VTMSGSGANYTGQIPGQSEGQAVYYKVQATDDEDGTSNSSVYQYTIAGSANLPPVINNVNHNPSSPAGGEAVTVSAQITDDSGVESALVLWGLSAGSMSNIEEMTHSGDNYQIDIPGQNEGLTIYFKVQAFDEEGEMTESSTYNYTVETSGSTQTLPFFEDFESEDLGIFNQYSVSGAEQYWHNDDFEDNLYAKMSNYNGSDNLENEDWMITNAINFNNYSNEVLHFSSSMKDYNDNNTYIYIKYSSNYNGSSDPNAATWTDLSSLASWSPGEYEWVASGDIDLSNINGTEVYLAFQYISQDGTGKTWQIDDVSVSIEAANPAPEISNISQTPEAPDNEDIVTVSAQITDDEDIEIAELQYGTSPSQMNENIDMSASGSNFYGDIPVQDAGLTIYYRIMAEDNEGAVSYSSIYNYYVDLAEGLEEAKQEIWSLYPNPAKDQIVINAAHAEILEINIFHSSGRFLYVDESYEANQVINLSGFAPGAYFIRIKNANKVETYRFIKQ